MSGRRGDRGGGRHSPWHWVTAALGLLVLVGALGYLTWDGLARRQTPVPRIRVAVDTIVATPGAYAVHVRVRNDGGVTASRLVVRGELRGGPGVVETRETTIDYVPPGSSRTAGLLFARDPRAHRLVLQPVGYALP